jgi:hypothetical protein
MGTTTVTLSLDEDRLDELRSLVGEPALANAVNAAIAAYIVNQRRLIEAEQEIAELQEYWDATHPPGG